MNETKTKTISVSDLMKEVRSMVDDLEGYLSEHDREGAKSECIALIYKLDWIKSKVS
jgi:hypothetical protein